MLICFKSHEFTQIVLISSICLITFAATHADQTDTLPDKVHLSAPLQQSMDVHLSPSPVIHSLYEAAEAAHTASVTQMTPSC